MSKEIKSEIIKLRKKSKFAYVGSVNEEGFPQTKCMFIIKGDSVHIHYFSTNTSSKRVQQFLKNPKASVYYCNETFFKGALFTGIMEVIDDIEIKKRFWNKGDEQYYPQGVTDPDYCILKFTAETVNYYHNLSNNIFSINEF
jgi:general stress protein 26